MSSIDVTLEILKLMKVAQPHSVFINSLYQQYCNRGGLSKKQLEGLHNKALKEPTILPNKLATLEAIIKKKLTRERAPANFTKHIEPEKDVAIGTIIDKILAKYTQHKRVVFLNLKYNNNEVLTESEKEEIIKFEKILFK